MGRFVLAIGLVAGMCALAGANGRPAGTSTLNFQQGNPQHIVAGMTFGLVISDDGGATWYWMCEKAVGYGGTFDPDYAYSPTGAIFATTFDGLKVMRDRCTFTATPPGMTFVSADELGPNGALYFAAADQADSKIYKSVDDGMTFPTSAMPGINNDWWDSLMVSPSDATRVYVTGYRYKKVCNATSTNAGVDCTVDTDCLGTNMPKCESQRFQLLFKSVDGGANFTPMSQTNIAPLSSTSAIDVVGIDPTNPNIVYIHVTFETSSGGDSIYKSIDGGTTWQKILTKNDPFGLVFLARSDHSLVAATQTSGAFKSAGGATCTSEVSCNWTALTSPPHINCLVENPGTHDVWACTHNFDSPGIPGDGFGIAKTADLASWTPVLRYQDIKAPVDCPVGTAQRDQCVESFNAMPSVWCCLEAQLGITSTAIDCTGPRNCMAAPDSPQDGTVGPGKHGCCETGGGGAGAALLAAGTGALLLRRRRSRR